MWGWVCISQTRLGGMSLLAIKPSGALSLVENVVVQCFSLTNPLWQAGTLLAAIVPVFIFITLTGLKPTSRGIGAMLGLSVLLMGGVVFVLTASVVLMFVAFEMLLLVSLYLLRLTAKSDRVIEAVAEMFF